MRRLALRKEALTELTHTELGVVAGASGLSCGTVCVPHSDFRECLPPSIPGCLLTGTTTTT